MWIYEIRNTLNNKRYIGQTIRSPDDRKNEHIRLLTIDAHPNIHLQRAVNKDGIQNFIFQVLNHVTNLDELNNLEFELINKYKPNVYNLRDGGNNKTWPIEVIERMVISAKKRYESIEQREKTSCSVRLVKCQPKQREKSSFNTRAQWKNASIRNKMKYAIKKSASKRNKTYIGIISPDGTNYNAINDIREFCKTHSLDRANVLRVMSGKQRQYKGWTQYA
jgi:group I intron endonuclease